MFMASGAAGIDTPGHFNNRYLDEGADRLLRALHAQGPKKRKAGRRRKRPGVRVQARRRPVAGCCFGRAW